MKSSVSLKMHRVGKSLVAGGLHAATLTVTDDEGLEGSRVVIGAVRETP